MAQTTKNPTAPKEDTKPVRVFRSFGVRVSIFANRIKTGDDEKIFHKVTLTRIYRDGNEFKTTRSLSRHDLPSAWLLLQKAFDYIAQAESGQSTKAALA